MAGYKYGDVHPVTSPVDSAVAVEIADLVYLDTDDVKSAGYDADADGTGELWNTNIATTQEAFHDVFLGVSSQRSRVGDTKDVRVSTRGVFEFSCDAATFEIGDLVGPAKTSGNNLENQKVVAVATPNLAIGRVAKRYGSNTTTVYVEIVSTIQHGGPQGAA